MALKAQLESLDGLDENVAALYKKQDDETFVLDVEPANGVELADTQGLKKALESERSAKTKAEKAHKELQSRVGDLDLETAREAVKKIEELGDDADVESRVSAAIEQRQQQLQTKFENEAKKLREDLEAERDNFKTEAETLESQLGEVMVRNEAITAINEAGGSVHLLLPLIERSVQMRKNEENGKREVVVLDEKTGNTRLSTSSGSTNNMSIPEFVNELKAKPEFGAAFKPSGSSGGGSSGSSSSGRSNGDSYVISRDEAKDVSKYRQARAEAEKSGLELVIQ